MNNFMVLVYNPADRDYEIIPVVIKAENFAEAEYILDKMEVEIDKLGMITSNSRFATIVQLGQELKTVDIDSFD